MAELSGGIVYFVRLKLSLVWISVLDLHLRPDYGYVVEDEDGYIFRITLLAVTNFTIGIFRSVCILQTRQISSNLLL